jgi:hypothetical protein
MFNITTLKNCWSGLIGFVNNFGEYGLVDADLSQSSTGIYADERMHPLFTAGNILNVVSQTDSYQAPEYAITDTYAKGQVVGFEVDGAKQMFVSLKDGNINNDPDEGGSAWWKKSSPINVFLRRLYDSAVTELANRIASEKKLHDAGKTLLKDVVLYEGVGNIKERVQKQGRFVGFRINMKTQDITGVLQKIGLQLTDAQSLTVYLYHSSSDAAIATFAITHTKSVQFEWHTVAANLDFVNDSINAGGTWYLGYYESDLTGEAINKTIQFDGRFGCTSCNQANSNLHRIWSSYFTIQPFYVQADDVEVDKKLWDADNEFLVDDMTFGINLQMAVRCDVTRLFCMNGSIVAHALGAQVKMKLLEAMAYSMRDNQQRERMSLLAAVAINDPEIKGVGARYELEKAIKAVTIDFSNVGSMCLPCDNGRNRLKVGSVYG